MVAPTQRRETSSIPCVCAYTVIAMTEPTWWTYFKGVAGTETGRAIAEAAGVSEPQVSRWKSGKNRPDADSLVRFARAYHRSPVEALVAAGYINATEAKAVIEIATSIEDLPTAALLAEIKRRLELAHTPKTEGSSNAQPAATTSPSSSSQSGTPSEANEDQEDVAGNTSALTAHNQGTGVVGVQSDYGLAGGERRQRGPSEGQAVRGRQDRDAEQVDDISDDD